MYNYGFKLIQWVWVNHGFKLIQWVQPWFEINLMSVAMVLINTISTTMVLNEYDIYLIFLQLSLKLPKMSQQTITIENISWY